jgi:hypothetical protein
MFLLILMISVYPKNILSRFEIYKNYKYDWVSIFLHRLGLRSYDRFICSDFINFLLTGQLKYISPGTLFDCIISSKLKENKL